MITKHLVTMHPSDIETIYELQYCLYTEMRRLRNELGITAHMIRSLNIAYVLMDANHQVHRLSLKLTGIVGKCMMNRSMSEMKKNGFIVKLTTQHTKITDSGISFIEEFNRRVEIKTIAYLRKLDEVRRESGK